MRNVKNTLKELYQNKSNIILVKTLAFIALSILLIIVTADVLNLGKIAAKSDYVSLIVLAIFLAQEAAFILPVIYFYKSKQITRSDLGLQKAKLLPSIGYILLGFIAFFLINVSVIMFTSQFGIDLPGYGEQAQHLPIFGTDQFSFIIAIIVLIFIAPLIEELLFRGFIYGQLSKNYGVVSSALATSLLFTIIHFEFNVFIPLFTLGMILNMISVRTKSIYPAIVFHMLNNSLAFAVELLVK